MSPFCGIEVFIFILGEIGFLLASTQLGFDTIWFRYGSLLRSEPTQPKSLRSESTQPAPLRSECGSRLTTTSGCRYCFTKVKLKRVSYFDSERFFQREIYVTIQRVSKVKTIYGGVVQFWEGNSQSSTDAAFVG